MEEMNKLLAKRWVSGCPRTCRALLPLASKDSPCLAPGPIVTRGRPCRELLIKFSLLVGLVRQQAGGVP